MGSCNLAQAGFVTRLADEYLDGIIVSRALSRPFVDACIVKIFEARQLVFVLTTSFRVSADTRYFGSRISGRHRSVIENTFTGMTKARYRKMFVALTLRLEEIVPCIARCICQPADVDNTFNDS
jgi:hypothetical protein